MRLLRPFGPTFGFCLTLDVNFRSPAPTPARSLPARQTARSPGCRAALAFPRSETVQVQSRCRSAPAPVPPSSTPPSRRAPSLRREAEPQPRRLPQTRPSAPPPSLSLATASAKRAFDASVSADARIQPRRRTQILRRLHIRWRRHIVRHSQIRQHLLRDALEHRPAHFAAVMRPHRRIQHHQNRNRRIVHRREAHKRRVVLRRRIAPRRRIDLLRRSRFPAGRVAVELRNACPCLRAPRLPSSRASSPRSARRSLAADRRPGAAARLPSPIANLAHHTRAIQRSAIRNRRNRRDDLNRRHAHFLSHGERSDRTRRPVRPAAAAARDFRPANRFRVGCPIPNARVVS